MIRKFNLSDLRAILEIEKEAFPKTAYDKSTFLYYRWRCPDTFLVYEKANKIVGYVIFYNSGLVVSIAVEPLYRRKGIGTELMEQVFKKAEGKVKVEVRRSNIVALLFYEKLAFKKKWTISRYYGNEDALMMIKEVK